MRIGARRFSLGLPTPANDNVRGAIPPDDGPFFLAMALIGAAVIALVIYVALSVPADDVTAVLRR